MKPEFENIKLNKNAEEMRFEIEVNGHFAYIDYKGTAHLIALIHTEAEPELAGTGAAQAVVEKTLAYIKESGKKLLPYCPYVFAYLKKHPVWTSIVDESFPAYHQLSN